MRGTALLLLALLLVGCVSRVPAYAPRRTDTPAHRSATAPGDCLDCHDLAARRGHDPGDDCLKCHTLCKGC